KACTRRWSIATCTAWSERTACRALTGRPKRTGIQGASSATSTTASTGSPWSSTEPRALPANSAGRTSAGTTRRRPTGSSRCGTGGQTLPSVRARRRERSPRYSRGEGGPARSGGAGRSAAAKPAGGLVGAVALFLDPRDGDDGLAERRAVADRALEQPDQRHHHAVVEGHRAAR